MHQPTQIKALFKKFIERKCSPEEVQQVLSYIKSSKELSDVPTMAEVHDLLDAYPEMEDAKADTIFNTILKSAAPSKKKSHFWRYAAASIVVVILVSGYFIRHSLVNIPSEITPAIVTNTIKAGTDKATLTLENGDEISLEKEKNYVAAHASSNGEALIYSGHNTTKTEIVYNYLTIPRGGEFQLQLADGTKVWLNSETKLKYPIAFAEGETRQVELLYGEAYFEVSPSTKHNGSKFNVKTHSQDVEVFGTAFNIKACNNETKVYTTLVEGKVAINTMNTAHNLVPNQQSILNLDNNQLAINTIDVYNEIAWKDGLFSFKGKPLKEIMAVLSRWYDIEFEFSDESIEKVKFNGVLLKEQSIEDILTIIKETKFINAYDIKEKIIIIK